MRIGPFSLGLSHIDSVHGQLYVRCMCGILNGDGTGHAREYVISVSCISTVMDASKLTLILKLLLRSVSPSTKGREVSVCLLQTSLS